MIGTVEQRRLAFAVAALMILAGMMGYGAARARGTGKPATIADHKQTAAITAERDTALAELADARKRHRIACRGIERLVEELTDAEKLNEALQRETKRTSGPRLGDISAGR